MAVGSGCSPSYLLFSYLGLPIGSNMSHISNWKVLIDRFKYRLSAPEAVIKVLESLRVSFFWGASVEKRKLAWVKWSNILAPLKKGGLGVGSLKYFNLSLLLKWRWRLMKDPSALWVIVLKSIHGDEAGFELAGCKTNGLWARIVGSIYQLHSNGCIPLNTFRFSVGDGSLIRFWKDIWLGDQPLCARYNRLFHLEKNRSCLIRDRIANGSWSWDWSRPVNRGRSQADFNNLLVDISLLNIVNDSDSAVFSLSSDSSFSRNVARKYIDDFNSPNVLPSTSSRCSILVSTGIIGFLLGALQKIIEIGRMPSLPLLVGFYGVLGTMSFLILIL
nr:RNA-directed DNA polymerase, eukaryota, reverse transcriptase zinc-binding domain protein [Tanacetum cinerariifolium]